jgi:hypothetical protein
MTMTDIDPLIQRHTTAPVDGRTGPSRRKRRRHPAKGARIVAAGLGASTMFGLVAAMGIASAAANSSQAATTPVNPAQGAIVPNTVTPGPVTPGTVTPGTVLPSTVTPDTVAPNIGQAPAPSGPIVLQARPQVSVVNPTPAPAAAAPAPAAVTSGSA